MKELLGLVGFGPEEETSAKTAETPAAQAKPAEEVPRTEPVTTEREPVVVAGQVERVERSRVAEKPQEPIFTQKAEEPVAQQPVPEPVSEPVTKPVEEPVARQPETKVAEEPAVDLESTRQKVAAAVERSFFSFGRKREQPQEPTFTQKEEEPVVQQPVVEEPVKPAAPEPIVTARPTFEYPYVAPTQERPFYAEETAEPPFIRPGATVVAAGATFFGDIRAEGDVEILGKLKGNLEATGNIRIVGKVLGDVKGDAVVLEGGTVQGNVTATSHVGLDGTSMIVGDVLATDIEDSGKVKGNLQIARAAKFGATALLAGNVIAATIMMAQGARVQGAVRIAEDPEANALFGELEI